MDMADALGYLSAGLVVVTFCMKTMIPLRIVAIGSNVAFASYGIAEGLLPILILHSILLPLNFMRLFQMQRLLRSIREATRGDLALEGLLPFMTRRNFKQGETLFHKREPAHETFYVLAGKIHLQEIDRTIGAGTVLGEISMFAPNGTRTATAVCVSDGELLAMSEDKVRQLYFQNPKFGFYLVQLITRRLIENCATMEAAPGRWPQVEGLPARKVA